MELRCNISDKELNELKMLYIEAFPPEERRPLSRIIPKDPAFRFYAIGNAGFITAWHFQTFTYIEHFAIYANQRGQGIGAQALASLSGDLILEVEPPETSEEAMRRIAFYERNGFKLLNVNYIQPPYSNELPAIELRLMVRGEIADIDAAIRTIHHRVYGIT